MALLTLTLQNQPTMRKILLFISFLVSATLSTFSQVPSNDLIANATLIDPSNFVDENLRLDLATASGTNPVGCGTGGLATVYYKFTATENTTINATLDDMTIGEVSQGFVIFFTAPDLNQTDESQLNVVSSCNFVLSSNISVTIGQSYYLLAHRTDVGANSRIAVVQGPPNDSIETAIEVTTSTYNHQNVRLDLAAENLGGQGGCAVSGFKTAYYKFTASSNGYVTFQLHQQGGIGVGNGEGFVIFYEAPGLNATDNELNVISNCSLGASATISIVEGQSYYVIVNRDTPNVETRVFATIQLEVPESERQALIDFYNATDGPNWYINTNWNTAAPVSDWAGVTVENGHVTRIGFGNIFADGTIPNSILDLTHLEEFTFYGNELSGELPDFSSLSNIETLDISDNRFSFADLESNFEDNSTITNFQYSPQKAFDELIHIDNPTFGEDHSMNATIAGTNLNYQWTKKLIEYSGTIYEDIPGATSSSYTISNFQENDLASYTCIVTSTMIPDLTLERELVKFRAPVSMQERDALIALYNSSNGVNWTNNDNWLTSAHVDDWHGIETYGNQITNINLNNNNLVGQIPDEIGNFNYLTELRLSLNDLTGSIPSTIGNLNNLRTLRIFWTNLSGNLPESLGNLTQLKHLSLTGDGGISGYANNFTGQLPSSLGNLTSLTYLNLQNNSLEGNVPESYSNLTNLYLFSIYNNNLSGTLPDWSGMTNPSNTYFYLGNNYFDFSDLAPLVDNGVEYGGIYYSPQRTLDTEEEIQELPGVDIELSVEDSTIDRNGNDGNDTATSNQYQWFKDGVEIGGANASIYTIVNAQESDSGVYHCEITNPLVPDLTIVRANITVIVDESLGIEDFQEEGFALYPNPAKDWITIKTKSLQNASVRMFNSNGQLLMEKPLSSEITLLAIDQLSEGVYFISIKSDTVNETTRFIKH